jgi:hypothetical protein
LGSIIDDTSYQLTIIENKATEGGKKFLRMDLDEVYAGLVEVLIPL